MSETLRLIFLQDANTRTVLAGTTLLGVAAAVVGTFASLRRRSLVGDAVAHAALPGAEAAWLEMPADAHGAWRVSLRLPGDPGRRFPHSQVWVDPWSGEVLHVRDARRDRAGDVFLNWMHPLHSGEAFGLTGRVLIFVAGLIPLLLAVTGFLRWRQKARVARHKAPVGRAYNGCHPL